MKINLLVIKTKDPKALMEQYALLNLKFDYHKHGNGPYHYASEFGGQVFEIYPLSKSIEKADSTLRLGFQVPNLEETFGTLRSSNWVICSEIRDNPWGKTAVVQDLDGRKVELSQQ